METSLTELLQLLLRVSLREDQVCTLMEVILINFNKDERCRILNRLAPDPTSDTLTSRLGKAIIAAFPIYEKLEIFSKSGVDHLTTVKNDRITLQFRLFETFELSICTNVLLPSMETFVGLDTDYNLGEEFGQGKTCGDFLLDIWPILQKTFPSLVKHELSNNGWIRYREHSNAQWKELSADSFPF